MPVSEATRKLKNGRKYETATSSNMSESINSETNYDMIAREISTDDESDERILTQEEVDEEIKNSIPPLTRQL